MSMNIVRAAELLEACAFNPDSAPRTFDLVADALELRFFHLTNLSGAVPEHLTGERSRDAVDEYLREAMFERDPWTQAALRAQAKHGELHFDRSLVQADARKSAYYRDYCPRHDVAHHGGWRSRGSAGDIYFAIFRSAAQGEFSLSDRRSLTRFVPSAQRAYDLMVSVREHRSMGVAKGLEAGGRPALLVDSFGRVSHVTPGAAAIFDQSFALRCGALCAADPASHRRLAIIRAVAQGRVEAAPLPNIIVLRAERRPLVLSLSPIRGVGLDALPGARLIVTIADLERDVRFDHKTAQDLFGLTLTEIEVATLLVNGASAEGIAAARGVRSSSVRQTIKTILTKTGTHRQAELVALLTRLGD